MKPAQAVTERYVNNLLRNGSNKEFEILVINRDAAIADDIVVGVYYTAVVKHSSQLNKTQASGAVPSQAVRRCLEKHGVTFR